MQKGRVSDSASVKPLQSPLTAVSHRNGKRKPQLLTMRGSGLTDGGRTRLQFSRRRDRRALSRSQAERGTVRAGRRAGFLVVLRGERSIGVTFHGCLGVGEGQCICVIKY